MAKKPNKSTARKKRERIAKAAMGGTRSASSVGGSGATPSLAEQEKILSKLSDRKLGAMVKELGADSRAPSVSSDDEPTTSALSNDDPLAEFADEGVDSNAPSIFRVVPPAEPSVAQQDAAAQQQKRPQIQVNEFAPVSGGGGSNGLEGAGGGGAGGGGDSVTEMLRLIHTTVERMATTIEDWDNRA